MDDDLSDRADYLESIGLELGWNRGRTKCRTCGRWDDCLCSESTVACQCGRGVYDSTTKFKSCYSCYLDRTVECVWCGRPHDPKYPVCYKCREGEGAEKRMEAGKLLRTEILIRDNATCMHCGQQDSAMQVDHIKPCRHGGKAFPWNLHVLCNDCNQIKSSNWYAGIFWEKWLTKWMHLYFTYGWGLLDNEQQAALIIEADKYPICWKCRDADYFRCEHGVEVGKYKVGMYQTCRQCRESGRHWCEHGGEFNWHQHYKPQPDTTPQWALDMADGTTPTKEELDAIVVVANIFDGRIAGVTTHG